jgi:hypothetical protein
MALVSVLERKSAVCLNSLYPKNILAAKKGGITSV